MIGAALSFVAKELNAFFRKTQPTAGDVVLLAAPSDGSGAGSPSNPDNRLLFTLANVLQENTFRNSQSTQQARLSTHTTPISINLHVLFTANFTNYVSGLDYLADVVAYLQAKQLFTHENSPGMDPRLDRLFFNMLNLEYSELSHLWGMFGASYKPSALYELRMLALPDPRNVTTTPDVIHHVSTRVEHP